MTFARPDPTESAVPLRSVSAVVLDTETTGLDVKADRIVQIGAVRVKAGRIDPSDCFDRLVNPGMAIPERSTRIHGIDDTCVKEAPLFAEVMPRLAAWAEPDLIIGYSIGFDLAVLKAEHERAGLSWCPPRSLDIAHLIRLLAPDLPAGLGPAAAWAGVERHDRHQALGDALVTAKVFLALVPKLHEHGIQTLAEAERACRALSAQRKAEAQHGWLDGSKQLAIAASHAGVDSYTYRHRLRDVMHAPPVIAGNEMALEDVLGLMMQQKVSSIFLPPPVEGGGYGIVTERDALRAIDAGGAAALKQPVASLASRPLVTLDQEELVYRAISRMTAGGFRHLGVSGRDGALVGALSARDLLRQRAGQMITLGQHIEAAQSAAELGRIWGQLASVAGTLVAEEVDARDVAAIISAELRALTKRACEIAESELLEVGRGRPPVSYAMLVLGSGGRGESLLAMDQDNAIVYLEGEPGSATDQWFEALGQRTAEILNDTGVAYCKGGVMASNAPWRMDVGRWRRQVAGWIRQSKPEDVLHADIFFDSRPVHGDAALVDDLMRDAIASASRSLTFLGALSACAADFEAPVGWFGRFRLKDGRVDVKNGGLLTLFSTARVLALRFGLAERSTRGRFMAARERLDHGAGLIGDLIEAHRVLLNAILQQQIRDLGRGISLSNRIDPSELTGLQQHELRWAFDRVNSATDLLGSASAF